MFHGPGKEVETNSTHRGRLTKSKLHHFIEFVSSPSYCQVVGFCSKTVKPSSGVNVQIPKVVRTVISSRIITLYQSYCLSNMFECLSRATLYRVIKLCAAPQETSLKGLDNTVADRMSSLQLLEKTLKKLTTFGLSSEIEKKCHDEFTPGKPAS